MYGNKSLFSEKQLSYEFLDRKSINDETLTLKISDCRTTYIAMRVFFFRTQLFFTFDKPYYENLMEVIPNYIKDPSGVLNISDNAIKDLERAPQELKQIDLIIKSAHQLLIFDNTFILPDLWKIVLEYFTFQDHSDMIGLPKATEYKMSFITSWKNQQPTNSTPTQETSEPFELPCG